MLANRKRENRNEDRFKLSREERQLLERLKADAAMRESGRVEKSRRQYEGREARRKSKARLGAHSSAMRKVASALATTLDLQNQAGLDLGYEAGSPSNAGSPGADIGLSQLLNVPDFASETTHADGEDAAMEFNPVATEGDANAS
ncbi:hypothetical protein BD309DRAFT_982490 [Dichomitus squalens]|nr:hypothetical protein BD309DRAFT_982490 [Dichomitus squalens]